MDWDQAYKFYSKNQKIAAQAAYKNWFKASFNSESQRLYEQLVENKALEVNITAGEGFGAQDIDKFVKPIIERINKELLEDTKPPEKIAEAKAKDVPLDDKAYVSGGYSVAVKNVDKVKKGKEKINFNFKQHVERKTVAGGFMGIGRYPDEMKAQMVTVVPHGNWNNAYFLLPAVADDEGLGISQVDLQIGVKNGQEVIDQQVVIWDPKVGWKDREGKPRNVVTFGLMNLAEYNKNYKNLEFDTKAKITLKHEVLETQSTLPVFNGETAVSTPFSNVDVVKIDSELLTFRKMDSSSKLDFVRINLTAGDRKYSKMIKTRNVDGSFVEPAPVYWLVEKREKQLLPVRADIKFELNDGSTVNWIHNGQDLRDGSLGTEILLRDYDWQKN